MAVRISSTLLAVASLLAAVQAVAVPAFPGAEGFGSGTAGGRNGAVLYVTTLDDHDDGLCNASDCTLREAINRPGGARIVLFKVGGTIVLDPALGSLTVTTPYLTIAGQSAPGDGIEIRNDTNGIDGLQTFHAVDQFASLVIATHDVVVRHIRIRPGPLTPNPSCTALNAVPNAPGAPNGDTCLDVKGIEGVMVNGASNVVLDHLSIGWASYNVILLNAHDVTIQNSISSEGLDYVQYDGNKCKSTHPPEECPPTAFSGMGFMSGNKETGQAHQITGRYTLHHNLFASNGARGPQITVNCQDPALPLSCAADVVNNVDYNWRQFAILSGNALGHHFGNVVKNFTRMGPSSLSANNALEINDYAGSGLEVDPSAQLSIYHSGNASYTGPGASAALSPICHHWSGGSYVACPDPSIYQTGSAFATPSVTTTLADQAYLDVLANAGATQRLEADGSATFTRDPNDARVIADATNGTGAVILGFAGFPGFPSLSGGTPYADSDSDGMPNTWESAQCLKPNVADGNLDPDGDVYTNLEEFLNGTDATPDPDHDGIHTPCDVACDDGYDNDGDGLVDLADPGCANAAGTLENPFCSDGLDNDNDGKIDYPADPQCSSASDPIESNGCGLLGVEVLPVLIGAALKSRRRSASA